MPVEVILPKVDMDMASGKIAVWHVAVGSKVEKGEPLFDIETDKAAMEVDAPATGYLHHRAKEGIDIAIGATVAWLYAEGEEVGDPPNAPASPQAVTAPASAETAAAPSPVSSGIETATEGAKSATSGPIGDKIRATPLARSLARENAVDLHTLPGSGPHGRVQAQDVRLALETHSGRIGGFSSTAHLTFADEAGALSVTRSVGGSGTPIVLIHGFANDASGWAPLEKHLRHRPVIRIDLPCHGKSPRRHYHNFAALVSDLRKALDGLAEETYHIVAHSLGGALAIAVADTRPKSVESLNLIAPAGLGPQINGDVLRGILRATRPESLAPWLKLLVADDTLISEGYARAAMASRSDPKLIAAQSALADIIFPDNVQIAALKPALNRLEMPVRIFWGKRDLIIPWDHALAGSGNCALHLFENIGHMPHVEAANEMGLLLRRYID